MSQLVLISCADIIIKTSCKMLKLVPFQLQRKCKMTQVTGIPDICNYL